MGRDYIPIVGFHGLPEKWLCAGKNCLAVGCGREIVDARSRVDEMVIRL